MSDLPEYPLVTFALFAYNQEKYVREAIEGAFSQTYQPLEIILSDDCSTDQTFQIMQEMSAAYRGPHTIRLNRNRKNLNIGGHVNTVNRLAQGELVVAAAGDDISMQDRTYILVNAWLKTNRKAGLLHSARRMMKKDGEVIGDYSCKCLNALGSLESAVKSNAHVDGATEAWDRQLFDMFGDLRADTFHEDCALTFRSLLANRLIIYVEEPMVLYRFESGVTFETHPSHPAYDATRRKLLLIRLRSVTLQQLDDLKIIPSQRIKEILVKKAAQQDAAIMFECGWPNPRQIVVLIRTTGLYFVVRMAAKRIRNAFRDQK